MLHSHRLCGVGALWSNIQLLPGWKVQWWGGGLGLIAFGISQGQRVGGKTKLEGAYLYVQLIHLSPELGRALHDGDDSRCLINFEGSITLCQGGKDVPCSSTHGHGRRRGAMPGLLPCVPRHSPIEVSIECNSIIWILPMRKLSFRGAK